MNFNEKPTLKIAILDLYDGVENQGMRGLHAIISDFAETQHVGTDLQIFDVRQKKEIPGFEFDIYISSGGPGSPVESEGEEWDSLYFQWLQQMELFNANPDNFQKKPIFFICHSFQLACRYFKIGELNKRKSNSFGIFPIHMLDDGEIEPVFEGLANPFYAVDSRDYQVIKPDHNRLSELGANILAIEKERPHIPLERAIMAIRFTSEFIGTQFHPEADPVGMLKHLHTEEKKKLIIENHGIEKWEWMVEQLNDPDKIRWTYSHVLPNFLQLAMNNVLSVTAA